MKLKQSILLLYVKNKAIFNICFGVIFIIIFSGIYYLNKDKVNNLISQNFSIFEVSGGNFDFGIKKIPYNTASIDISFSKKLDENSIIKNSFKINPKVPGILKLKDGNTLSYQLSDKLKIGQDYTITLSKSIKSFNGKTLDNDIIYIVSAFAGANIVKVLPENNLVDLNKNLSVFFSLPMVSLSDLESKDSFSCPLEITPKIDGKCSWTTTSVLEFIPKKSFAGATKYDYKITNSSGMNYKLENDFTGSFTTPELQVNLNDSFTPKNYINLSFNYPVSLEEITKNLKVFTPNSNNLNSKLDEFKIKIESVKNLENSFLIKPLTGEFNYDTDYKVKINAGLKPKYGNISLKNEFVKSIKTTSLISDIFIYKNIYSSSGTLIDTKNMTYLEFIPNNNIFFNLNFFEEVALNKEMFLFKNDKTGAKIDFDIAYIKEEKEEKQKKEIFENKTKIRLDLKEKLENNSSYSLILLKKANISLVKDIVYTYKTSKDLQITNFKFLDYSKSCLYVNNTLDELTNESLNSWDLGYYSGGEKFITFSNSGIIKSVSEGQYIEDWQFEESLNDLSFEEKNKKLLEKGYCPNSSTGEILYAIETRLSPNMGYDLNIAGLKDIYGNTQKTIFKNSYKTTDLKESDKYVYTSFANNTNVFPTSVPVVVNIQTINTKKVWVEVCEMNDLDYKTYLKSPYGDFSCGKKVSKELETKLVYWKLTHNKFDLEDDILGYKSKSKYIGIEVYSSLDKSKSKNYSKNLIVRTNLSVFLEKASNKSLAYVTDLEKNIEVPNLEFEFYDFDYKKTTVKYSYDKTKKVYVIDSDLNAISYILVKNDKYFALISQDDFFSNYDFKYISGQDSSIKNYAYIYSDRPIYRPGDEVQIKGLLREFNFDGYKKSKITSGVLKLIGEDWQTYRTLDIKVDKNSNFTGSFVIPKDSTLGDFRFQFTYKIPGNEYDFEVYTNGGLSIEAYRKPSFKVEVESSKNDVLSGEKVNFKITPKYYFGGKMINTSGNYSILSQNYFFDGKEYSDYQFGEGSNYFDCIYWGYCNYGDKLNSGNIDFKIDENGEFNLEHTFGDKVENLEKIYTFNFEVKDRDTSKTVNNSVSKVLHTTDSYVGLKANYYNSKSDGINFQAITLDYDAKPVFYKNIKVEVIKKEYKQVKKLGVDGVFYNEYAVEDKLEKSFNLLTDDKGQVQYNTKTLGDGEYELKVSYTGLNKKTFTSSQIVYVAGKDYISWGNDNNTVTDLESDKITYKLGETATFVLKSPINNGKALIVVEKDDGILDYFVHDIKSYGDKIELKLTNNHYPNVYLKAYLIGSEKNNPLPVFKRALSVVKVLTDYKKLNVTILTDKKNYKPGDKMQVTVEVTDNNGKVVPNANGSLSVVDESVLALKGNPKKNPYSFFYDMKRYLGVISYSNLKYLVEKLEVKDVSDGEKGGAGDQVKGGETKKPRGNFKDTAFWLSDFTTNTSGKAIITIPVMPDNLTTWVLEALVSTIDDNKIGINYLTVMTTNPLMIEDNLPRFLSTNDNITFTPVIYNKTGKDDEFIVKISSTNGKLLSNTKTIFIKNGESSKVEFSFDTQKLNDFKSQDISTIIINAQSKTDKTISDSIKKIIPINNSTIVEYTSTVGKTSDISFDEKINLGNINKKNATLTINYAGTLFNYLFDSIDYLANYPYGNAEQKTSSIMPNIYIKKLYNTSGKEFDLKKKLIKKYIDNNVGYKEISVDEAIKDYLIEIKKFGNTDGGFIYWYDTKYKISDIHLTNYILTSLSDIKSLGYDVDKKVLDNAKNYLKNEFYKKAICNEKVFNNCISLELKQEILLALNSYDSKDYEVFKMYKTLDISKLTKLQKAKLTSKLLNISSLTKTEKNNLKSDGVKEVSNILTNELIFSPKGAFISASSNSRVYNTTILLEIIGNIGLKEFKDSESIVDNMIRFITSSKINGNFGSTYDNLFIIKALTTYLSASNELKNTDMFTRFSLNNEEIITKKINKENIFESFSKTIEANDLQNINIFNITKKGSGSIYYDLNLKYFVPTIDLKARDEGFYVDKKYFSFNEYKKIEALKDEEYSKYLSGEIIYDELKYPKEVVEYLTPIKTGKVGDLVLVYNKVVTNEDRDQVALESFIPSGSEIVNTSLATENKEVTDIATNIYLDRKEFRDDMYFGFVRELQAGIYNYSYTIRLTHTGDFNIKPSQVFEFYNPEVFGRSRGEEFIVE